MNLYEFEISLVPYFGKETKFLYTIKYKDKNLEALSSFLDSYTGSYSTYPMDILEQMLFVPDKKTFVEGKCGGFFNDIEMEHDIGKTFLERDWSTGHNLGEIACILGPENPNEPMIYYRALDSKIILVSQNNDKLLPTILSIEQFLGILKWWVAFPPFPISPRLEIV